jgi:uncharacterized protein YbjT (DUF2867 family)
VAEAVAVGWQVRALTRSDAGTQAAQEADGLPIRGDARQPDGWIAQARGATALVDLLQPRLPRRLTRAAVQRISAERQALTRGLVAALQGLPAGERPLFVSVSGADDLQPDARSTGFRFRYPSYREGVPATLARLGYAATTGVPTHMG